MSADFRNKIRQQLSSLRRVLGGAASIEAGPAQGMKFDGGADTRQFTSGSYEPSVQSVVAEVIKAGEVCYDIGANLGFMTLLCGRLAGPSGAVYAFEPVPRNVAMIERNVQLNALGNVKVFQVALAAESGTAELLLAKHVGGAVLKSVGVPPPDPAGSVSVKTSTLDALIERERIRPPTFIKLDVEGAEEAVLQGMVNTLRTRRPKLLVELDDEVLEVCESKVLACSSFLRSFGYEIRPVPNAYKDGSWFVRHFLAVHPAAVA